jgi:hypothetical protein
MYRCCGITGLVAAAHAREVMLSDYTPEVINTIPTLVYILTSYGIIIEITMVAMVEYKQTANTRTYNQSIMCMCET